MIEAKVTDVENDIKEIKTDIKKMPEEIAKKMNESIDIKIKLAISETERKYQAKFIGMLLAIIGEAAGLIVSFLR